MNPTDKIEDHFRITPNQKKALHKIKLHTIGDLLWHFPTRYGDSVEVVTIGNISVGAPVCVYGSIRKLKTGKTFKTKMAFAEGKLEDETGSIELKWFRQPYLAKMLSDGDTVKIVGTASDRKGKLTILNPQVEKVRMVPIGTGDSLFADNPATLGSPVYPESKGITSNWFHHTVEKIFKSGILDVLEDPIPVTILKKYSLPALRTAMIWVHTPRKREDAESARKRFAFEEILYVQIKKQQERTVYDNQPTFLIEKPYTEVQEFVKRFPFTPTSAQVKAIKDILDDFASGRSMSRLLEGDVGAGKTAVAAATVYAVVETPPPDRKFGALQTAFMAPTEILAQQHFESFIQHFAYLNISVGLITGSGCKKFPSKLHPTQATDISRAQLLRWVANGDIPILIGTHALIQETVKFKNLAYIIIDEQHKFGINQRRKLRNKDDALLPHLLSMTATPIPRTLSITMYGDLDISLLDELPAGRGQVKTRTVTPSERPDMYNHIRQELAAGRQAYVICPRIFAPDPDKEQALQVASAVEEAQRLAKDVFPEYAVEVLHGKIKSEEKEAVMDRFAKNETQVLVSTSVVEVGVNVPNATIMIIEGAERFGLAQLHQLRGRISRSTHEATCYLLSDSSSEKSIKRLHTLATVKNGFQLAEHDLAERGPGELSGNKQWGISDMGMEAIKNLKMVEAARTEAGKLIKQDIAESYPALYNRLKQTLAKLHLE